MMCEHCRSPRPCSDSPARVDQAGMVELLGLCVAALKAHKASSHANRQWPIMACARTALLEPKAARLRHVSA